MNNLWLIQFGADTPSMMIGIQKFDQKPVYKIITDGPIKNYLASSIHYQSINKSRNRSSISSIKNIPFYSISAAQIFVESRIIHPYVSIPTQRCQKISPRRIINFQLPVVQPSSTPFQTHPSVFARPKSVAVSSEAGRWRGHAVGIASPNYVGAVSLDIIIIARGSNYCCPVHVGTTTRTRERERKSS